MNLNDEIELGRATVIMQKLCGYIGSVALIIGGLAMYVDFPIIGKVTCLYCPTLSGILYILLAIAAIFFIYKGKIKLLYLTGGLAFVLLAFDVYKATTIGYALQTLFSGGFSPSTGGQMDPVMTQMIQNTDLSIPVGWIIIVLGALLMILAPQIATKKEEKIPLNPREVNLKERMQELDKIINMYKDGDLSKQEFSQLKDEILGTTKEK